MSIENGGIASDCIKSGQHSCRCLSSTGKQDTSINKTKGIFRGYEDELQTDILAYCETRPRQQTAYVHQASKHNKKCTGMQKYYAAVSSEGEQFDQKR